jgi:trans-aconitate 2-methyltransferase
MTVAADRPTYAFGHSDLAARRLQFLAEVFAPATRAFVGEAMLQPVELAIDLGCGPGDATHRLAGLLACERVVGFDISERFVGIADGTAGGRVSFCCHDFTQLPFPTGPADLMYARFVLTHMAEPEAVVSAWASQLRSGGVLLLEETEWIRTSSPTFTFYLDIVERMLAEQSHVLYIGPQLAATVDRPFLGTRSSMVRRVPVDTRDAARMFRMNLQTWKQHPFVQTRYPSSRIETLQQELDSLVEQPAGGQEIEWGIRQMVLERL